MRRINQRDLHTELGEMLEGVTDLEAIVSLRLDIARQRQDQAKDALEHMESEVERFGAELEEATSRRTYWESQLRKIQDSSEEYVKEIAEEPAQEEMFRHLSEERRAKLSPIWRREHRNGIGDV